MADESPWSMPLMPEFASALGQFGIKVAPAAPANDQLLAPPRNPARMPAPVENAAMDMTVNPIRDAARAVSGQMTDNEAQDFALTSAIGLISPGARLGRPANAVTAANRNMGAIKPTTNPFHMNIETPELAAVLQEHGALPKKAANANRVVPDQEKMPELVADEMFHSDYLGSRSRATSVGSAYQKHISEEGDRALVGYIRSSRPDEKWAAVNAWEARNPRALEMTPAEQALALRQMKHMEEQLSPGGPFHGDIYKDARFKKFNSEREKLRASYNGLRQEFGLERVDGPGWSDPNWAWKFFGDTTPAYRTVTSGDLPELLALARKDKSFSLNKKTTDEIAQELLRDYNLDKP